MIFKYSLQIIVKPWLSLLLQNLVSRSSESGWRILNDSTVTEGVSWDQFVARTSQHGRDTPYLLLYQRLGQEETEETEPSSLKLSRVMADNTRFTRERESLGGASVAGANKRSGGPGDRDDGGGGPQCRDNFGQIGGGGRFVC